MFKNHEFRIKMVKTPETPQPQTLEQVLHPDSVTLIEEAGKRFVKHLALAVTATVVSIKVIDIVGEVIIKNS